jgi:prepilin-type N-terminal cleavage/methylation domain-containing protein
MGWKGLMRRRRRGFTLIEILIALVIVSIGLIGILALLTSSLKAAGEIVEDSIAATVARSVYESLREGTRKRGFIVREGTNYVRGFVFVHEGIKDTGGETTPPTVPNKLDDASQLAVLRTSDFTVFLPPEPPTGADPIFVYPRPTGATAENSPYPGKDDSNSDSSKTNIHGQVVPLTILRTYQLKQHAGNAPNDVLDQYSFAFAIQRAISPKLTDAGNPIAWGTGPTLDTNVFPPKNETRQDGLYQVEVMVFRNFDVNTQARSHEPVVGGRFVGLLALGP